MVVLQKFVGGLVYDPEWVAIVIVLVVLILAAVSFRAAQYHDRRGRRTATLARGDSSFKGAAIYHAMWRFVLTRVVPFLLIVILISLIALFA